MKKAIAAGKHVYCEKPTAVSTESAYELYEIAKKAGVKNGVVQDKLWLPGLVKLRTLIDSGFFGENPVRARGVRLLGVRRARRPWSRNARAGTTARKTTAASSWTCSATGAT